MENTIQHIEKKYNIVFDASYDNHKHIIINIFNNNDTTISETNDPIILNIIGLYYQFKKKDYEQMKKYYLMAIIVSPV